MKTKIVIGVIVLIVIVTTGMAIYVWNSKPRLVESYPQAGAINVPATSPIRLVFSRAMDQATVNTRLKIEPAIGGIYKWDKNTLTFTPNQSWPGGQTIKLILESGARAASWISFPMGRKSWNFIVNEAMLAYLWPSDGRADIYALTPTTGEIRQFTRGLGVLDFTVSNNGITIYFSAPNSQGGVNLYRIDRTEVVSSTEFSYQAQELLDCGTAQCRNPVVSFDDLFLAYEYILPTPSGGSLPAQIWMLNLTSSEASPIGQETHETVQPSWSSTGLLAYYDRTSSGYEVNNPLTQERVLLSNQTGQPGDWSPSGEYYLAPEIFYYQAPKDTERGTSHLIRYSVHNTTTEDLSQSIDVEDVGASYSPDGSSIAFARKFLDAAHWTLGRQIWIMDSDGSNSHPITAEPDYNHYDLAWSRDGLMLAYVRFDESRIFNPPELWMVNPDGSNALQLVIRGYSPIWIP